MKKILSFLVMGLVATLPLVVSADTEINYNCGEFDAEGVRTCTIGVTIDTNSPQDSVTVKLTEFGGAEVTDISGISDSAFDIITQNEVDNVWTVVLSSPGEVYGEYSLLTFKYKKSGSDDCKVTIGIGDKSKDLPDTPTPNVKTGSTLPYIALGTIAIIAGGAYIATKNKSKMYKI